MNQVLFPQEIKIDFRETARAFGVTIRIPAGGTAFRQNDPPDNMYVLLSGEIEIRRGETIIDRLQPGEALGMASLLDNQPRSATAFVTEDAELAVIDRKNFRFMVETVPNFVWYAMAELVGRLRAAHDAVVV